MSRSLEDLMIAPARALAGCDNGIAIGGRHWRCDITARRGSLFWWHEVFKLMWWTNSAMVVGQT